jgi:hypothetical protein
VSRYAVGKDEQSRWRFLTPDGQPFFLRAVYAVQKPVVENSQRLVEWGFNAVGPYSHWSFRSDPRPVTGPPVADPHGPYTYEPNPVYLAYMDMVKPSWYAVTTKRIPNLCQRYAPWRSGHLPDVFHPGWEQAVREVIRDPDQSGWLHFGGASNPALAVIGMDDADQVYGFGPGSDIKAPREHGHIAEIVWANPDSHAYRVLQASVSADAFLAEFADRYFRTVTEAIREYVPGVLVMSPDLNRWGGLTRRPILLAAGRHCDIIHCNLSSDEQYAATVEAVGDKPLVTWEALTAQEDSMFKGQPSHLEPFGTHAQDAPTQAERGRLYAERLLWLTSKPQVAGLIWWEWQDNLRESGNYGLVNAEDKPYEPFVAAVAAANLSLGDAVTPTVPGSTPDPPKPQPAPEPPASDEWGPEIEVLHPARTQTVVIPAYTEKVRLRRPA